MDIQCSKDVRYFAAAVCRDFQEGSNRYRGSAGEVELYRNLRFSDFEPEMLAAEVRRQLRYCRDRATAGPTPPSEAPPRADLGDPVTGGSVSGNIRDVQAQVYLSRETQSTTGFQGPLAIRLPEISVAGSAAT